MRNDNDNIDLLPMYYTRLQASFDNLLKSIGNGEQLDHQREEIKNLLGEKKEWDKGYEIERRMVFLMEDNALDFEIRRKLLDSKRYFNDDYISLYQNRINNINLDDNETKKNFLYDLIKDIQWKMDIQRRIKPDIQKVRHSMVGALFLGTILTLTTFAILNTPLGGLDAYNPDMNRWYFPLVLCAGFTGTVFSMLTGLSTQSKEIVLDELDNLLFVFDISVRIIIGTVAALLMYYFFRSELITTSLFPNVYQLDQYLNWKLCNVSTKSMMITEISDLCNSQATGDIAKICDSSNIKDQFDSFKDSIKKIDESVISNLNQVICSRKAEFVGKTTEIQKWSANLYKLIILSFLAGFSEKLVPNLLDKTKSKISDVG